MSDVRDDEEETFALPTSFQQRGFWYRCQLDPESPFFNMPMPLRLRGRLDVQALVRTLEALVERNELLRTTFALADGRPVQLLCKHVELALTRIDISDLGADDREREITRIVHEEAHKPLDLARGPLFRTTLVRAGEEDHVLALTTHHILADGWSQRPLNREIAELYAAFSTGTTPSPPPELQYADYALWQEKRLTPAFVDQEVAFWRNRLVGAAPASLPTDRPRGATPATRGARHVSHVPAELVERLRQLAREENATLFMLLFSAFAVVVRRHAGTTDVTVGTPVANRVRPEFESMVGLFVNMLALRIEVDDAASFRSFLRAAREACLDAYGHQELPFELLVERLKPSRRTDSFPLFQLFFGVHQETKRRLELGKLTVEPITVQFDVTRYDLELHCVEEESGGVRVVAVHATELYDASTIQRFASHFVELLKAIAEAPDRPAGELPLSSKVEESTLDAWSDPAVVDLREGPSLEAALGAARDRIAVRDGERRVRSSELLERAADIAALATKAGVGTGDLVALAGRRCVDWVACVVAAESAGISLLLVDDEDTAGRERAIAEAKPRAVLRVDEHAKPVIELAPGAPPAALPSADTAYVVATPRGMVVVSRRAARLRSLAIASAAKLEAGLTFFSEAALDTEDLLLDVHACVRTGATLAIRGHELAALAASGAMSARVGPSLRRAVATGVALPAPRALLVDSTAPATLLAGLARTCPGAAIVRIYALPETGPVAASGAGTAGARPIVVDALGKRAAIDVPGRVCVRGEALATGYLGHASSPRFGEAPPALGGGRWFSTGDRGRLRDDGRLELCGADDGGAWLPDRRVDARAIEDLLERHPRVAEVAVLARDEQLAAYVVAGGPITADELVQHLDELPRAERPTAFSFVNALPRDSSGALDVAALSSMPAMDARTLEAARASAASVAGAEEVVVLGGASIEPLGVIHVSDLLPVDPHDGSSPAGAAGTAPQAAQEPAAAKPALLDGGPLEAGTDEPASLVEALRRAASAADAGAIVHIGDGAEPYVQSYAELERDALRVAGALRRRGVRAGDPVVLQVESTSAYLVAFWGCVLAGAIAVPAAIGASYTASSPEVARLVSVGKLLGEPCIVADRRIAGSLAGGPVQHPVYVVDDLSTGEPIDEPARPAPEAVALMLLTSGSTGVPKLVTLPHRQILANVLGGVRMNDLDRRDVSFNWMPLDHVGGLVWFHLRDTYLACQQVHARTRDILEKPTRWLDVLDRYRVSVTWAPSFAYALVNERHDELARGHWDLSCVRMFLNGGEAIVVRTARRFLTALAPHGLGPRTMRPLWGMSEISSAVTYSETFALDTTDDSDRFCDVGRPIAGMAVRIVDDEGAIVSEGASGHVQARGATVMAGYFRNPETNRDVFTDDGWFRTGDLGLVRHGELVITSRDRAILIINGANFYSQELEAVVEEVAGLETSYTVACGVRSPGDETDRLVVFFVPLDREEAALAAVIGAIRSRLVERTGLIAHAIIPVSREDIPKTGIGKIQRASLKRAYEEGRFDAARKQVDLLTRSERVVSRWFHRSVWRPRYGDVARPGPRQRWLVIGDERLAAALRARVGADVVSSSEDFGAGLPDRIIHAVAANSIEESALSVTRLVQAISAARKRTRHQLDLVTFSAQPVAGADVDPTQALAGGVLRCVPLELDWLTCRHVDADVHTPLTTILDELETEPTCAEVAFRRGRRLVPLLEAVDFDAAAEATPIQRGGFYVVTGGLGGIGSLVARALIERYDANVLIVGRSALGAAHEATFAALVAAAEAHGSKLAYERLPLTTDALEAALAGREAAWGSLAGVFHFAGVGRLAEHWARVDEHHVVRLEASTYEAMFEAKVHGTRALGALVSKRPGAIFVASSSVDGIFGGATFATHAAANRFVDAYVASLVAAGVRAWALQWSIWAGVGMAEGNPPHALEAARALGYLPIDKAAGVTSLFAALRLPPGVVAVGLDDGTTNVRRRLASKLRSELVVRAFFPGRATAGARAVSVDGVACELCPIDELPRDPSGEIDREALAERHRARAAVEPLGSETEQALAAIWREILGVSRVAPHDSFFAVGGDSLKTPRLSLAIREKLGTDLSLRTIVEHPTLAALAGVIDRTRRGEALEPSLQSRLVRLSAGPRPFFCVHGASGSAFAFTHLAQAMGDVASFVAVEALGLAEGEVPQSSIAAMADLYVAEIRAAAAKGPYLLGGWSLGGVVAVEIARRLKAAGESIERLVLIDSVPHVALPDVVDARAVLAHALGVARDPAVAARLARPAAEPEDSRFIRAAAERGGRAGSLDDATITRLLEVFRTHVTALAGHVTLPYDGPVHLVEAASHGELFDGAAWRSIATHVESSTVPGDHDSILVPPHVEALAARLRDVLTSR